ncbi:hypothetical protein GWI33_022054 [Rhynchophorus ferrugineus]|uniref:Uncharacterized protein n=1 Tax=Rhynchophorus ferrugineus TaxID=354439 RepID=A0A834MLE3_RHYFE|nr:hypothetical protein GWI33_022054 [Rhynchophorus ferrugineus]
MSTEDGERSGRPKVIVTDENIKKINKIILKTTKLCAKWVPRELTVDQKQRRVDDSEQCLKVINRNKPEFLRRYVTMDATWPHH